MTTRLETIREELSERVKCSLGNLLIAMFSSALFGIAMATSVLTNPGGRWGALIGMAWATPWFLAGYILAGQSHRFNPPPRQAQAYTINLCPNCTENANDPNHDWLEA